MGYLYKQKSRDGTPGRVWWAKYYVYGRPVRESTGTEKEAEAKQPQSGLILTACLTIGFLALVPSTWAAGEASKVRVVGTYTNLKYNSESGDLGGVEIKIVPARGRGFQGVLQIAEGSPSEIMVVDVVVEQNKISFRIPTSHPIYGGGTFEGVIEPAAIRGHFTFGKAVNEEISLKRGRGYWDK